MFVKSYKELCSNGVTFPSENSKNRSANARQREARGGSNSREEKKISRQDPGLGKSATQANLGSVLGAAMGNEIQGSKQQAAQAKRSSGFAVNLKKEMQFVRDESKKGQKYLQLLEQQGFVVESMEKHAIVVSTIQEAQQKAERCIETLMSDTGNSKISNTEELMNKILGFQDQLRSASEMLAAMPVTVAGESDPTENLNV